MRMNKIVFNDIEVIMGVFVFNCDLICIGCLGFFIDIIYLVKKEYMGGVKENIFFIEEMIILILF